MPEQSGKIDLNSSTLTEIVEYKKYVQSLKDSSDAVEVLTGLENVVESIVESVEDADIDVSSVVASANTTLDKLEALEKKVNAAKAKALNMIAVKNTHITSSSTKTKWSNTTMFFVAILVIVLIVIAFYMLRQQPTTGSKKSMGRRMPFPKSTTN
jgi:ATP-dependent Zn protease